MKIAHKLMMLIVVLLATTLSVAGYFTVRENFNVALAEAAVQNQTQHSLERYALEQELAAIETRFGADGTGTISRQAEALSDYLGDESHWQAIYRAGSEAIYSTLPASLQTETLAGALTASFPGYFIHHSGNSRTMVFVSHLESIETAYHLVSAYDVTPVFTERQRQLSFTLRTGGIILLVSLAAIAGVSIGFTRPIHRLNAASHRIAGGAYEARADVDANDEIGALGRNFNKMADAVETQMERLNLSLRQREDFVAAFTHEVKTPMTAIIGYSDMLRFQETDLETRQMAAGFIYREASRLEALSQKLLLLMGLSDEKVALAPVPVEVLFHDAAHSLSPHSREQGIDILAAPAEGLSVLADRDLVVDLLRNLLLNAINAHPRDGKVQPRWQIRDDSVVLSVQDRGKGIPEEELARITEPFYMVDKSRTRREGGSGVGLALCQRICELHGSTLELQSKVDEGTTVSFALNIP